MDEPKGTGKLDPSQEAALERRIADLKMQRDPRTDPREDDLLIDADGSGRQILVSRVGNGQVYYLVYNSADELTGAFRVPMEKWCKLAHKQCIVSGHQEDIDKSPVIL
jgi:hypothetical protein